MTTHRLDELLAAQGSSSSEYLEFLRVSSMSAGLYVLAAGAVDRQSPHTEDEVYVVLRGRARFSTDGQTRDVQPADTIFVAAHAEHRFHDISEELVLVVVFAPPERSSRAS